MDASQCYEPWNVVLCTLFHGFENIKSHGCMERQFNMFYGNEMA